MALVSPERAAKYDRAFREAVQSLAEEPCGGRVPAGRPKFYLEDIYTDDLDLFSTEYDRFLHGEASQFFFQANIANIALLLRGYHRRDYDAYFRQHSRGSIDLDRVHTLFQAAKGDLINALTRAYTTFAYADALELYQRYLTFYGEALIHPGLPDLPSLTGKPAGASGGSCASGGSGASGGSSAMAPIQTALNGFEFVYLSCVHCAEPRQARFFFTRFLESYIGLGGVHGEAIICTRGCIGHDFYFHGNLTRVQRSTDEIRALNRDFILALYRETPAAVCQYGLRSIFVIQNEGGKADPIAFDRWNYFLPFKTMKNTRFILHDPGNTSDTILGFLNWLNTEGIPFTLENFAEEGRGYTIT